MSILTTLLDGISASLFRTTINDNFTALNNDKIEVGSLIASAITNTPSGNIASTTVQGAINELQYYPDFYQYSIVRSVGNLVVNNSFETDLSGWNGWLSASFTRDTTEHYSGSACAKIVTDGSTYAQGCYSGVTTKVGFQYVYSAYVKGTAGKQISMFIDGGTYPEYFVTLTGGWDRITGSVTATANWTSIYIQCRTPGVTTYWIDAVQVEEGTTTAGPFTTTQGNLTVALKNYEGNDPTPTKPVKIQIGGVVRTITSALGFTMITGVNWLNLGSAELATKEVDIFTYLRWDSGSSNIRLDIGRLPSFYNIGATEINGYTIEKGLVVSGDSGTGYPHNTVNIGRFNATLSAGAGYTWSLPATSRIINGYINDTRYLDMSTTVKGTTGSAGTFAETFNACKYKLVGNTCIFNFVTKVTNVGSWTGSSIIQLPFTGVGSDNMILGSGGIMNGNNGTYKTSVSYYSDKSKLNLANNYGTNYGTYASITANDFISVNIYYEI